MRKKSHGRSMHSQNSQAGVDLTHLHFEDPELVKQGEDVNILPKVPEAEVAVVGCEPRLPA